MKRIPKKIFVGSHTFTVELTKPKDTERQRNNWGKTMIEEKRVLIDKELCESQMWETLIHELLHICMHQSRVSYDLDDGIRLTEEQIVMRLSEPLHEILVRNKLLTNLSEEKK